MKTFTHPLGFVCNIMRVRYDVGCRLCLHLIDTDDGQPCGTITVNVPDAQLSDGEIVVETGNGMQGVAETLEEEGIATFTGRTVRSGHVAFPVMHVNEQVLAEYTGSN